MQKDEERWVYEYIQAAKNLEEQLAKKNFKLSDELSYYTDCYYPQDVVKELLLDENGTVNGVVPVLSELKKDYYYCEKINGEYNFVDVEEEHVKLLEQQLLNLNYWIPCSGEYNRLRFSCYEMGEYEERPLYFMDISLDAEAQNRLIWKFREWYGDTD